jgi:hypothetical protein
VTNEELRSVIIECLQKSRPYDPSAALFRREFLFSEIAEIAKNRNLKLSAGHNAWLDNRHGPPELFPRLKGPASDIVWDLIIEGILRPGTGPSGTEFDLPYIHVTEFGKAALQGNVTPYDPNGYLRNLNEKVPNADPVIVKYIAESAETLRRNCFLSSTVTLGCASEKAFLLLLDTYRDALNPADQATLDKALAKARGIKQEHEVFMKDYDFKLRPRLKATGSSSDSLTALDSALGFIFGYFRDIRNSAGHPTGTTLSREVVTSHLVVFPHYLRALFDLMEWIDANKPL